MIGQGLGFFAGMIFCGYLLFCRFFVYLGHLFVVFFLGVFVQSNVMEDLNSIRDLGRVLESVYRLRASCLHGVFFE